MVRKSAEERLDVKQYIHSDKTRVNNPPVGLVTAETDNVIGKKTYKLDPHLEPELQWAGKAEGISFEVDTVSLHVHQRVDPLTIVNVVKKIDLNEQQSISRYFDTSQNNPPIREAIEFYKHPLGWTNRIIAGDSLLIMNSFLEKERLGGKVQMVYIDPPYGIRYGSNFQPFVNKRDVQDQKDEDLTQQPEMIKAFRDAWELGVHSYLSYLRNNLILVRDLLTESGSVFVQISDENLHHVKEVMDEIFHSNNFVSIITIKKTAYQASNTIANVSDYLLWYSKNLDKIKTRPLYVSKLEIESIGLYRFIETPDGKRRAMTEGELEGRDALPYGARRYRLISLVSQGHTETGSKPFTFERNTYKPPENCHWKTTIEGLKQLVEQNRIVVSGKSLAWVGYIDDFPVSPINNIWTDTMTGSFTEPKKYVVQTNTKIVDRCILMTTDPGDLILDPTCGSGTTAYSCEKWGRRWVTCDTSRVSIALAKQRLMTSVFDFYELARPEEGVGSGFNYAKVHHISMGSIANKEEPKQEILYDHPKIDKSKKRITGPFTVEAVPSQTVRSFQEVEAMNGEADSSISRSGETAKQNEWIDEMLTTGIKGKGGQKIEFIRVDTLPGTRWIHADAETKNGLRAIISFGPQYAPLEQRQVELTIQEAQSLVPRPKMVLFASFQFDPEAAKDIDELNWPGVEILKVQMNTDLLTSDLKKKRASNESFLLIGQPDVEVKKLGEKYIVSVNGFDYYNTRTGEVESGNVSKIAMWELDTDYDGRSLYPSQIFFPMASEYEGWARLSKLLKTQIDESLIEKFSGYTSVPFKLGDNNQIAVKIIDDRGIESLKIIAIEK